MTIDDPTSPIETGVVKEPGAREEFQALINDYVNILPHQFTSRLEELIDKHHPKE